MSDLIRREVAGLPLYDTDSGANAIDLSDNTSLWGAPPAALRVLREMSSAAIARYPSSYSSELQGAIKRYVGLDTASVVVGCGSDDILDSTMRAFGSPGDRIACCSPTFVMIPVFAKLNALELSAVPFMPDGDIDAEELVARRSKITYLCSPNNPTGVAASRAAIEFVVDRAEGVVVLDCAYAEFSSERLDDLVSRSERLIIVRTFSKAFGMAGLRLGYGFGSPKIIDAVARARGPYKVTRVAELAAFTALSESQEWVREHAALAVENRERLTRLLRQLGLVVLSSDANFVFVPTEHARAIHAALRARGVWVRLLSGMPTDLPELAASRGVALRIGVGPWDVMETLITALREALECA